MKIHKFFLMTPIILLLNFSEQGLAMEDQSLAPHPAPISRKYFTFPLEIQEHISSFLDQRDLLRAGGVSKVWRQAVKKTWKIKPLDLSKRTLKIEDFKALANGQFSSLILQSVKLGKEELSILAGLSVGSKRKRTSEFELLDLSNNKIRADAAKNIAIGNFSLLTTLNLSNNELGDDGAKSISIAKFPLLTTLNLSRMKLEMTELRVFLQEIFHS